MARKENVFQVFAHPPRPANSVATKYTCFLHLQQRIVLRKVCVFYRVPTRRDGHLRGSVTWPRVARY